MKTSFGHLFNTKAVIGLIVIAALLIGGGITWYKSSSPSPEITSLISPTNPPNVPVGVDQQVITQAQKILDFINIARQINASQQDLINDPKIGYKGITGQNVKKTTIARYKQLYHEEPNQPELQILMDAIVKYVNSEQDNINRKGVGFKNFFPAIFYKVAADQFNEKMAGKMHLKLTAPNDILRNPLNKPDPWENFVFEQKFMNPSWPRGKAYAEVTNFDGKQAYRIMIPEYYKASCLKCHGEPKGEIDVSGYPKEGKKLDDLDGAVSLSIILDNSSYAQRD